MSRLSIAAITVTALSAALLVAGCGGGGGSYYYGENDYPQYRYLSLYLRVEKPNGDPLGGATVTIEGEEVDGLTASRWYQVGSEGPSSWRGWLYNWAVGDFQVLINREGQVKSLTVRVARDGWGADSAEVKVRDADPDRVYVRVIFVLGVDNAAAGRTPSPEYLRPGADPRKV